VPVGGARRGLAHAAVNVRAVRDVRDNSNVALSNCRANRILDGAIAFIGVLFAYKRGPCSALFAIQLAFLVIVDRLLGFFVKDGTN
jgi:hypothetical protein